MPACNLIGNVYFGDLKAAVECENATIINLSHEVINSAFHFPIDDVTFDISEDEQTLATLKHLSSLVLQYAAHGNVLICCKQGVNRSALVAASYLMRHHNMKASRAIAHLRVKNRMIGKLCLTNPSFVRVLCKLSDEM